MGPAGTAVPAAPGLALIGAVAPPPIERCDKLDLHIKADNAQQNVNVSAYVTTLVMNYLFTGKFKRTK